MAFGSLCRCLLKPKGALKHRQLFFTTHRSVILRGDDLGNQYPANHRSFFTTSLPVDRTSRQHSVLPTILRHGSQATIFSKSFFSSQTLFDGENDQQEETTSDEDDTTDGLLQQQTAEFLQDKKPCSAQMAAHLIDQWLVEKRPAPRYARWVLLRWLRDWKKPGDADTLSQYFLRVLMATSAPEAYELFKSYHQAGLPMTIQAISLVSERMLPLQWEDGSDTIMEREFDQFDRTLPETRKAQNRFLLHVPWTGNKALKYLETKIVDPDAYSYTAVIQKYIDEHELDLACALAEYAATKLPDATVATTQCMWALAKEEGRAKDVERLFRTLKSPCGHSYSALLQALTPDQGRDFILQQTELDVTAQMYGIVMNKYAKQSDMGEVVEELLKHASRRLPTSDLDVLKGITITSWRNTYTWEASDRATAVYMSVENPSVVLTTALLQVWAKSTRPDAADRCVTIFQDMVNKGNATVTAYNLMLCAQTAADAWDMLQAQAGLIGHPGVLLPTAASWATVLARPGHSVERIYEIVSHYKESLKKKQRDDTAVFTRALLSMPTVSLAHTFVVNECWSNQKRDYSQVYLVLLKRWSTGYDAVAPERAEQIAQWIIETNGDNAQMLSQVQELLVETWRRSRRECAQERLLALEGQQLMPGSSM